MEHISLIDVNKPEKLKQVLNDLIEYKNNGKKVTALDLGLENVDNTSDINKPVSNLQKAYIDNKNNLQNIEIDELKNRVTSAESSLQDKASFSYVDDKVAGLVNSAPETLDTLGEVAAAINENEDIVEALNNAIGAKADKTIVEQNTINIESLGNSVEENVKNINGIIETLSEIATNSKIHFRENELVYTEQQVEGGYLSLDTQSFPDASHPTTQDLFVEYGTIVGTTKSWIRILQAASVSYNEENGTYIINSLVRWFMIEKDKPLTPTDIYNLLKFGLNKLFINTGTVETDGVTIIADEATQIATLNGTVTLNGIKKDCISIKPITFKAGETYTFSINLLGGEGLISNVIFYNSSQGVWNNSVIISANGSSSLTKTFTQDITYDAIAFQIYSTTFNNYQIQFQAEQGNTASSWVNPNDKVIFQDEMIKYVDEKKIAFEEKLPTIVRIGGY